MEKSPPSFENLYKSHYLYLTSISALPQSSKTRRAKVAFSYAADNIDELSLEPGQIVEVLAEEEEGWWRGKMGGKEGVFPSNFVEIIEEAAEPPKPAAPAASSQPPPPQQSAPPNRPPSPGESELLDNRSCVIIEFLKF